MKALEATIEKGGRIHFREHVKLPSSCRVIVTFLDPPPDVPETALLSEATLGKDWNRPEEDAAWAHLQSAR